MGKKTKVSDLSMYDKPFNLDEFIFSRPLVVRQIRLSKLGFQDIVARMRSDGSWEGLAYTYSNGDKRWLSYEKNFVENYLSHLPEDVTLKEEL